MTDEKRPVETSLAEHIPAMEVDHRAALEMLYAINAREMSDADFEKLVRSYREKRRQDAAKRMARDRLRAEAAQKKLDIAARKVEREAKKIAKAKGGGEGISE